MDDDEFDEWQQAEPVSEVTDKFSTLQIESNIKQSEEQKEEINQYHISDGMAVELQDSINMHNQVAGSLEYSHSANLNKVKQNIGEGGSLQSSFNLSLQQSMNIGHQYKHMKNENENENEHQYGHVVEQYAIKQQALSQQQSSMHQSSNPHLSANKVEYAQKQNSVVKSTSAIPNLKYQTNDIQIFNYKSDNEIQNMHNNNKQIKPNSIANKQLTHQNIQQSNQFGWDFNRAQQIQAKNGDHMQTEINKDIHSYTNDKAEENKQHVGNNKTEEAENDEWEVGEVNAIEQQKQSEQHSPNMGVSQKAQNKSMKQKNKGEDEDEDDQFGDYEETSNVVPSQPMPIPTVPPPIATEFYDKAMELVGRLPNYNYMRASYFLDL